MPPTSITTTREQLETWRRRLDKAKLPEFHFFLQQFWYFAHGNPILNSLFEPFWESDDGEEWAKTVLNVADKKSTQLYFDDPDDHVVLAYYVIGGCVEQRIGRYDESENEIAAAGHFLRGTAEDEPRLAFFKGYLVEPLFDYLETNLNSSANVLALLRSYKHKCEWFGRNRLDALWKSDTARGEWLLKLNMFEYLHDAGVMLSIDPYADIGKPDLVAGQATDDPLVADAKLIKTVAHIKKTIVEGFHQVYKYTLSYNEPFGYLIVFNGSDEDIEIGTDGVTTSIPYVQHNGKTIYILVIDICPNPVQASKRGPLKPSGSISRKELVAKL